jgi:hypothetical protein
MNDLVEKLKAGKARMADRCREVATKLAEEAGVVTIEENRSDLTGRASARTGCISVPPPTTRRRLYIFAHECGHVALNHIQKVTRHREEYEAEQWAHDALRRHGIAVPRKCTENAKGYVKWRIDMAVRRGAKQIDKEAAKWSGWTPSPWWNGA